MVPLHRGSSRKVSEEVGNIPDSARDLGGTCSRGRVVGDSLWGEVWGALGLKWGSSG